MRKHGLVVFITAIGILIPHEVVAQSSRKSAAGRNQAASKSVVRAAQSTDLRQNPIKIPEAEPGAERLDFKATLKRALEKSPDFRTEYYRSENATILAKKSRSQLLPSLDLQASHSLNRAGIPTDEEPDGSRFRPFNNVLGLTLKEELAESFEGFRQLRLQNLLSEQARLSYERQKNRTLVDVARTYFEYSEAAGAYQLAKSQYETTVEQFKTIEARHFQGMSSSRDYLRSKADKQRSEISVLNQSYSLKQARENLKTIVGESGNLEFIPFDTRTIRTELMSTPPVDPESTLDYRFAKLGVDASQVRVQSAEFAYWPRLGLSATAGLVQPNYLSARRPENGDLYWNFTGLITIDYNIWDWGIRRRDIEYAKNDMHVETAAQDRARLQVEQNLNTLFVNQSVLQQTFQISSQTLDDSEDVYTSLYRGYREGKVTYIELNTALGDLYASRSADLQLRFNILKARAEIAYFEGKADEVLNSF